MISQWATSFYALSILETNETMFAVPAIFRSGLSCLASNRLVLSQHGSAKVVDLRAAACHICDTRRATVQLLATHRATK